MRGYPRRYHPSRIGYLDRPPSYETVCKNLAIFLPVSALKSPNNITCNTPVSTMASENNEHLEIHCVECGQRTSFNCSAIRRYDDIDTEVGASSSLTGSNGKRTENRTDRDKLKTRREIESALHPQSTDPNGCIPEVN